MDIKDKIRNRRHELNMTLDELSSISGISKTTLHRIETSVKANIRMYNLEALASSLNVPMNYLLGQDSKEAMDRQKINSFIELLNFLGYSFTYDDSDEKYVLKDETSEIRLNYQTIDNLNTEVIHYLEFRLDQLHEKEKGKK